MQKLPISTVKSKAAMTAMAAALTVSRLAAGEFGEKDLMPTAAIASGYEQGLDRVPGVVTVISREDIERMGATTIEQVLQTVPGLHVSTARGFRSVFAARGIVSQNNADFLIKINDVPVRDIISGGRSPIFSLPVRNIRRIEVVLGPGSLMHGSDAIGGIINIVTLTGSDLIVDPLRRSGTRVSGYGGSLNTFGGSLITGGKDGEMKYALALEAETTAGSDRRIGRDAATALDERLGTSSSHAPGRIQQDKTQFHLHGEVEVSDALKLRGGFRSIASGSGTGIFLALSPEDSITNRLGNFDLEYSTRFGPSVRAKTLFSYQFRGVDMSFRVLPESPVFPQGLLQDNRYTNHQFLFEQSLLVESFANHTLRFGLGSIIDWLEDTKLRRNFLAGRGKLPVLLKSLTELREVPGVDDPSRDRRRRFQFFTLAQDEWNFLPGWHLTYGARVDTYSDEENVISPRLALIHHFSPRWTGKLLYNRAYHMPAFTEHGFRIGRLDPEVIDMVELAAERFGSPGNRLGASVFWYHLEDFIDEVPGPVAATGFANFDLRGMGAEIWATYRISDALNLKLSYAFQRTVETKIDQVFGLAPTHMAFAELNFKPIPGLNFNFQAKWIGERLRAPGDPRKPLAAYALLSLNLRKEILRGAWIDFGLRNLLDADAREPSNDPMALPGDIPLPGRTFLGRLEVEF